jgi:hypothetical protein
MKNTLLSFTITLALAASAYGQYTIDVVSNAGGAFENLVNTGSLNTQTTLPTNGAATGNSGANAFVTDASIFGTSFIAGLGNVDVYKFGVANTALNTPGSGGWSGSSNAHSFSLNVVGTPTAHGSNAGPRWRRVVSTNNGGSFNGNWSDLNTGANTMSFGAVAFERSVAIQIAGVVNFDSFSHNYGGGTDSITVSAVPEPSSYALLAGLFACTYIMVRRRAVS